MVTETEFGLCWEGKLSQKKKKRRGGRRLDSRRERERLFRGGTLVGGHQLSSVLSAVKGRKGLLTLKEMVFVKKRKDNSTLKEESTKKPGAFF